MKNHVILIDDNDVDNMMNQHLLQRLDQDLEISIIDDSRLAFTLLEREFSQVNSDKKTIIFLDENMPNLNGLEIMEALEDMEVLEESNVQVYFLTGDTSMRLVEKAAIMENVVSVIHKPLNEASLAEIVL
ncbi:MAG: response regulator [Crocinitomix sp.]|nr:response regulator [Crocinitomix sp.]